MVTKLTRGIVIGACALSLAVGLGATGGGHAAASYTKNTNAEACAQLQKNMAMWNDAYWDAVIDHRPEDAADAYDGYKLNERKYNELGCGV